MFSLSTANEVSTIIREFTKAIKSNNINSHFLKAGNIVLAPYLSTLFNYYLMNGVYLDGLKVAEVVPIFKKDDPNDVTNYKPISLLSNFNKIFEKLVYQRLKYNLLSNHEHGFKSNSSTNFAPCDIYEYLLKNIDQNLISCFLFLDLSKADTVDLKILDRKLKIFWNLR